MMDLLAKLIKTFLTIVHLFASVCYELYKISY